MFQLTQTAPRWEFAPGVFIAECVSQDGDIFELEFSDATSPTPIAIRTEALALESNWMD